LGRWFHDRRTSEDLLKAVEYFQQAIDLDPDFALAHSGLADVYMSQAIDDIKIAENAREAAQKALELDDTLAEAYTSRANIRLVIDWDLKGAEADFKKALELNPNYAAAHHWYSRLLTMFGRHEEAILEMEKSLELNPTDISSNRNFVPALICARQFDRALKQAWKTYAMDPDFLLVEFHLITALFENFMYQEILEFYDHDEENRYVFLAKLLMHAKNNRDEARQMFDEIAHTAPGFHAAIVYARLGDADKVFEHLERSYKNRLVDFLYFTDWPDLEEYQSDPRFQNLLRKVGLD
jgi:tetratricopeptide (TPR) repeat protein